jgi:phosphoribosylaminoimidazolecarboxamide formyltransferase / IMP cyclohydrolase
MTRRALVSVTDKDNLEVLVEGLARHGWEIVSTGGTYRRLQEIISGGGYDIPLLKVSEVTGSPEMFDGRVKTLHPRIHGGILYDRNNQEHGTQASENGVDAIDMVVVNLYTFEKKAAEPNISDADLIEAMDIGGPTMLTSGIKNNEHVTVVADPTAYQAVVAELDAHDGDTILETRRSLAAFASNRVADYRAANAVELTRRFTGEETLRPSFRNGQQLGRYGENWHQRAVVFTSPGVSEANVITAQQLQGPALGYNNYVDAAAALAAVREHAQPAAVVVKHTNPCGMATSDTLENALERAWQGDSTSAFGSILAFNREVDLATMKVISERANPQGKKGWFVEVMVAPSYTDEVLQYIQGRKSKAGLRLLAVGELDAGTPEQYDLKYVRGGVLQQTRDDSLYLAGSIEATMCAPTVLKCENSGKKLTVGVVTERKPELGREGLYDFAWKAAMHTKSNAIVICREYASGKYQVLGMGAGQPNRKDSCGKLAVPMMLDNLTQEFDILMGTASAHAKAILQTEYEYLVQQQAELGAMSAAEYVGREMDKCVLASDAFFPFPDGVEQAAYAGIRDIVQPGGGKGDQLVIDTANKRGIVMVFTGRRHFKH